MGPLMTLIRLLCRPRTLKLLLSFYYKGYLVEMGWFTAFQKKQAIDADGNPIPWLTYSFIDFLRPRLHAAMRIFEYGSGNSTLFYAQHVKQVISVEHDKNWFDRVSKKTGTNVEITHIPVEKDGEYAKKARTCPPKFDLIIVDGRDRVHCCQYAVHALKEDGVIILDNSERPKYEPARTFLRDKGFKELAFSGLVPGVFCYSMTSVFYKSNNCLGI